ncbi:septal ring lytic transglycosylase RlpA family protein [Bartonella sp. B30(2025)]
MPNNKKQNGFQKQNGSIVELISKVVFIIAVSQLLISCSTSKFAKFTVKNSDHNRIEKEVTDVSLPKKVLKKQEKLQQNKLKKEGSGYATVGKPYQIKGKWYYPKNDPTYKRVGEASWYGSYFHGRLTANGEIYDMNLLTAAHPTMPLPSYARVTNLENGASLIVRVNDRGPFMKDRIIDLSKQAATILGYVNLGVTNVKVEYISSAPIGYYDGAYLMASYTIQNPDSLLALADSSGKKEDVALEKFDFDTQKELVKVEMKQKLLNKFFSIKLPDIGPILVNKPVAFDQVAFVNEKNKKINTSWFQ